MKLRYSPSSPYVRKVMLTALETGQGDKITLEPTNAWSPETDLPKDNPLGKVPALLSEDGVLYDSPVICEYLDSLHTGATLFPSAGAARWTALRRQALADGLLDAALLVRVETLMRPGELLWQSWLERQQAAVRRALDEMEREAASFDGLSSIGEIACAAALGYLDFRDIVGDWRPGRPTLTAWYQAVSQRPSMVQTQPKG